MMTDPIANMFIRIKNAANAKHGQVVVPYSRVKENIANIFAQEGFIGDVQVAGEKQKKSLIIGIKYRTNNKPIFSEITRISKPSRRVYIKSSAIEPVRCGRGVAIISTSKGIMKDDDARAKKLGGEIIASIW
ncbi:MAG: 30S ribosomal protein S8 [Pseudomonadota bacterium]